jgi:hypothetical protein
MGLFRSGVVSLYTKTISSPGARWRSDIAGGELTVLSSGQTRHV